MRLNNLKVQFAIKIPFGTPDLNRVVYSREAVEKAVSGFEKKLPIMYRDNDAVKDGVVVGFTHGDTVSTLWENDLGFCEVVINGTLFHGGTECVVNEMKDGVVTDFDIRAFGLSR